VQRYKERGEEIGLALFQVGPLLVGFVSERIPKDYGEVGETKNGVVGVLEGNGEEKKKPTRGSVETSPGLRF
jgi:hypothetical protein